MTKYPITEHFMNIIQYAKKYFDSYTDKSEFTGNSQNIEFILSNAEIFNKISDYFQFECIGAENIFKNNGPRLLIANHGLIPWHMVPFGFDIVKKYKVFPKGLGAHWLFKVPVIRDFFLAVGTVDGNHKTAEKLLNNNNLLFICPGGMKEAMHSFPGKDVLGFKKRYGFIKLAVKTGSPIIPAYCFGINDIYSQPKLLLNFRYKITSKTGLPLTLPTGILGLIPRRKKLILVIGKPLEIKKCNKPTEEMILGYHKKIVDIYDKLFSKYKKKYGFEDRILKWV